MNEEQIAKIESGVADCLNACRATERPFLKLSAFLDQLKSDPSWTDEERIELQTRVIRVLVYRMEHGSGTPKS